MIRCATVLFEQLAASQLCDHHPPAADPCLSLPKPQEVVDHASPNALLRSLIIEPLERPGIRESIKRPSVVVVANCVHRLRCKPSAKDAFIDRIIIPGDEEETMQAIAWLLRALVEETPSWLRFVFTVHDGEGGDKLLAAAGDLVVRCDIFLPDQMSTTHVAASSLLSSPLFCPQPMTARRALTFAQASHDRRGEGRRTVICGGAKRRAARQPLAPKRRF